MRAVLAVVLVVVGAVVTSAQVQSRPTDPPIVTAEHDPWFINGDPVQYAGGTYYRAGAAIFFDGNRMVRTGSFNGVPLYADTTVEPFSIVLVPIGRGLMQPYERPRSGDLAGTVGSRAPSFPVSALPSGSAVPMAPSAPTSLTPAVSDQLPVAASEPPTIARAIASAAEAQEAPAVRAAGAPVTPADLQAARERVWIDFQGEKWIPAGAAIPLEGSGLTRIGDYAGFPVYARGDTADRVYVAALPGLVTPYERKR
jgi:hypothetical protein